MIAGTAVPQKKRTMDNFYKMTKRTVLAICVLLVSPCIFFAWLEKVLTSSEQVFSFFGHLLSLAPAKLGSYLRVAYYLWTLDKCSSDISIGFGTFFPHRQVEVGSMVGIGAYCVIGCVKMGDNVMIASRVSVISGKYQHHAEQDKWSRTVNLQTITIGSHCWIGEGAIVANSIGEHCMVSVGTVVTKDIPPNCLIVGNPCRIIKRKK